MCLTRKQNRYTSIFCRPMSSVSFSLSKKATIKDDHWERVVVLSSNQGFLFLVFPISPRFFVAPIILLSTNPETRYDTHCGNVSAIVLSCYGFMFNSFGFLLRAIQYSGLSNTQSYPINRYFKSKRQCCAPVFITIDKWTSEFSTKIGCWRCWYWGC